MSRQNLSQQTADRLYTTIVVEQQLQPGEKLPNELELAQQLGVSRATLREAIRTLADRGVLEVRRGRFTASQNLSIIPPLRIEAYPK